MNNCRNGLNIYTNNELKCTFIEIVNPTNANVALGIIYRYPSKDLTRL